MVSPTNYLIQYLSLADGFDCRRWWPGHRDPGCGPPLWDVELILFRATAAKPSPAVGLSHISLVMIGHQWAPMGTNEKQPGSTPLSVLVDVEKPLEVSQLAVSSPQIQQPTAWFCPFVASLNDLYRLCVGVLPIPELSHALVPADFPISRFTSPRSMSGPENTACRVTVDNDP